ncbi:MFS transporter [Neobacillus piezotolerans]|uniref:MFS transporter n=1 Tax=Neobacillus piezotolerans TaxID=2259171 RepID=A0A3D8GWH6_9BACI|nr:MDR family MFS transporter [Neobacillus piezotolerans]RDU38406.1 MFS transporter [Neobacillus piezotolerans]
MGEGFKKELAGKKQTRRPFVLASVMLAMFMGAIEATIVSTAMPAIVGELGGFSLYSWVFSAYLLMNSVTVLIYGKLADLFGRKPVLLFGLTVFMIGSILCGLAENMKMLIVFRLIQGFGAGAVMPIATTIVGDIYNTEERAKIQGYLSSVWGISAILGPAIGGLLVEYVSWHYVFWVNIPLGILSMLGLWVFLHEKVEKKDHEIDYIGAILLTVGISSLMYILVEGGHRWNWLSLPSAAFFLISFVALTLFVFNEKRAAEPMMPFSIWKEKSIFIANIVSLTTGVMLIGISSFLPAFVQGVMEQSPIVAGFALTAMSIGWPIASTFAGKISLAKGYRFTCMAGGLMLIVGGAFFATMSPAAGPVWAAVGSFFTGVGMGLTSTAFILLIQGTVGWQQRGIATASNMFMRNLGNTIGAALLGGILNSRFMAYLEKNGTGAEGNPSLETANLLLDANERAALPGNVKSLLQEGLTVSLHTVYIGVLLFAVISMALIVFLPKKKQA